MIVLLQHLWPALLAAALLGLGFAAVFGPGSGLPSARVSVGVGAALGLLAAALLSVLEAVPGRAGLWLDIAVLCALAYAAGLAVGAVLRMLAIRRAGGQSGADATDPAG